VLISMGQLAFGKPKPEKKLHIIGCRQGGFFIPG